MQTGELGRPLAGPATDYGPLAAQARALFAGEHDFIANAANLTALVYHSLAGLNWVGFYLLQGDELVLGPFQGHPACVRIGLGKGVCGAAAQRRQPLIVPDVHAFPGHIACDARSRSEMVLPLLHGSRLLGVFDLDSPSPARFSPQDCAGVALLLHELTEASTVR